MHIHFGEPLSREEIQEASACEKNDRYQKIRHAVDQRIIGGYHLWKTNYMAYDIMNGTDKYASLYQPQEKVEFQAYLESQLMRVEPTLDKAELRDILLHIYGNPVFAKENQ